MNLHHMLLATLILMAPPIFAQVSVPNPGSGYAPIHGLKMYYEIHGAQTRGDGIPLILLHGGVLSTDSFSGLIPTLSAKRDVIAVDLQAHGRTADINRPFSYEAMGDDIAALAKYLHLEKVDVFGYSLGGGVALRLAIQHPQLVRKLVVMSAHSNEMAGSRRSAMPCQSRCRPSK